MALGASKVGLYGASSAGVSLPIITDGLSLYLDANKYSGSGTTWYDISGNSKNFTWNSSPSFTSGSPSYFSTSGKIATGPASNSFGINNTSGYSVFVICQVPSLESNGAFHFYKAGTGDANRGIHAHLPWTNGIIYFDQGGCCAASQRLSVSGGTVTGWNIFTFTRDTGGSTRKIYKNASLLATETASAVNIDLNSTGVEINSSNYSPGWNAKIAEFFVYSRGLSASEITENYNALKDRYGL